ncbi:ABC transporter transmembrane protein [Mesocricetibacter intestinalis]|uniref:ABC transporter transmembrane protein n=1 Tax=Mesocricetibacter intestinalis TaxID=1521930 RepID=A0A4R6VBT1_9PAST|nr:ABC transporter six-transmembrane domain-containing protein [Mesocricetibacter intestinalis]TDQ57979.1 ABC transporter transmembrane protein [Mesocricetibacter intestinalis]
MWHSLKKIALDYHRKLMITFSLVAVENLLFLTYPVFAGFSINAMMKGELIQALSYAVIVLVFWLIGGLRRKVDTQTFARIYSALAVPVILNQRKQGKSHSSISARVALSREFVDFFETHLPIFITSLVSIVGSVIMLLLIEFWLGIACSVILFIFAFFIPRFVRKIDYLYLKLNNRLEKEVGFIGSAKAYQLNKHYQLMAKLRIYISNREALNFIYIGSAMAILFAIAISMMTHNSQLNAGHIYAVMTYLWTFATGLDDSPKLIEQYAKLKDVGKRVDL